MSGRPAGTRDLVYLVATSADGFIAREDGSFEDFPWDEAYIGDLMATVPETFPVQFRGEGHDRSENRWFDAVLMGRETYEVGRREGVASPYPTLDQYVISTTIEDEPHDDVRVVREDVAAFVSALKDESGKAIWLCGGATLAGSLMADGLVDRLVLKVNPVVFGSGIPLFRGADLPAKMTLTEHVAYPSGHVRLHYALP